MARQRAKQGEVTVRPVILKKNDWIANHLDASGQPVGSYYDLDNDRFYAAPNTAVRRLHEYFWRYLIVRFALLGADQRGRPLQQQPLQDG